MTWIKLDNPIPKSQVGSYSLHVWDTGKVKRLNPPTRQISVNFFDSLNQRRSSRDFGLIDTNQLTDFLWYTFRSLYSIPSPMGFEIEHRIAPSAGGIHPIHVLINRPNEATWWLYEPKAHFLIELPDATLVLGNLRSEALEVMESPLATQVLLVAEPGKTCAKYEAGSSLVWRDAGVLIGFMSLTTQALGLHFCPLGITGEPWASDLSEQRKLVGVGMAFVGSNPLVSC